MRHHRTWPTLFQIMACCLAAPSHYLSQSWLIINEVLWHLTEGKFTGNTQDRPTYPRYGFEDYKFKITTASPIGTIYPAALDTRHIDNWGHYYAKTMPYPTEQHNVVTALQNVASLHAVQLCYSVGSSLCNVVNGTRKAVNCNVVQRCGGSCTTLPNVIQRCAMLSHRCQTLSNVVQRCNKAVRCCIKAVQRFKLYNAAIVQRCATLPNVIQRNATL